MPGWHRFDVSLDCNTTLPRYAFLLGANLEYDRISEFYIDRDIFAQTYRLYRLLCSALLYIRMFRVRRPKLFRTRQNPAISMIPDSLPYPWFSRVAHRPKPQPLF